MIADMLIKINTNQYLILEFDENRGWDSVGLEFNGFTEEFKNSFICKIVNKERFLWAHMKYGFEYETYNPYKSFVRITKGKI